MLATLAARVRQIGSDLLNGKNPDREKMRTAVSKRDELIELRESLLQERARVEARVAACELTPQAVKNVDVQLAEVRERISIIDNKLPQDLLNGCADESLWSKYHKLLRDRTALLKAQGRIVERERTVREELKWRIQQLESAVNAQETHPNHPQLVAEEKAAQKQIRPLNDELAGIEADKAAAADELTTLNAELESVKAEMRNS